LRYHSVLEGDSEARDFIGPGIIHSAADFADHMSLLAARFNPVTLDDIWSFIHGQSSLPPNSVAVTFDDGFRDNYTVAAPILSRYGIRAAFYVTAGFIEAQCVPWYCALRLAFQRTGEECWVEPQERRAMPLLTETQRHLAFLSACRTCATLVGSAQQEFMLGVHHTLHTPACQKSSIMMTWEQVRGLHQQGHIVGSHTVTHPNLAYVSADVVRRELQESQTVINAHLAAPVVHFSYPSPILEPHCTLETAEVSRELGYRTGTTCLPGTVRARDNALLLRRVAVPHSRAELRWALEAAFAGYNV